MSFAPSTQNKLTEQTRLLLRWMTWLTVGGLLALAWFLAATPIKHDDLFWHLQSGEWMVQHGRILHHDAFSYTRPHAPWITHEWLFSLLCYAFYRMGGTQGLIVLKQLLAVALVSILIVTTRRLIDPLRQAWLWPILCLVLCLLAPFLILRAALVTSLFLALLWWALQRDQALQQKITWAIGALLFLAWGNLHAGVIFGFVLLGGLWCEAVWRSWRYAETPQMWRVTTFGGMGMAASLINPNGLDVWLYPWYLNRFFYHSGISFDLGIFAAPTPSGHPFFFLFLALCLLALWSARRALHRIRFYEAFASLFFLILALRSNRFIDHFALLSLPWCVRLLLIPELRVNTPTPEESQLPSISQDHSTKVSNNPTHLEDAAKTSNNPIHLEDEQGSKGAETSKDAKTSNSPSLSADAKTSNPPSLSADAKTSSPPSLSADAKASNPPSLSADAKASNLPSLSADVEKAESKKERGEASEDSGRLQRDAISQASVLLASLTALAVIALAWLLWQPAVFVREPLSRFPAYAAAFVQKHRLQGRIFHHQNEGGFYGWKLKRPVFWDGRNLLFAPLVKEFVRVKDFSDILQPYRVEILLVNHSLFVQMKPWLERHRERWSLVYWDDQAAVYVLNSPSSAEWLTLHRYRFLRPFGDMPRLHDWANVPKNVPLIRAELARAVHAQPNAQLPRYLQGLFALYTNDLSSALRALQQAASIRPKKQVYLSLSYTLQRLQRFDEARLWLQKAQQLR